MSNGGDRFVDPLGIEVAPGGQQHRHSAPTNGDRGANSPATAAMVLGIIAVTIAWLPFIVVLGVIAAVLALAFGVVGVRHAKPDGVGRSRAVVGLVTGASALLVAALGVVLTFIVADVYDAYLNPATNEAAITSCEVVGLRATATGSLTNLADDTADFSVLVGFVRSGTDNPNRTSRAVLDDVEPGQSVEFEVARQVDLDEVDCIVIEVTGPLPFGLALD